MVYDVNWSEAKKATQKKYWKWYGKHFRKTHPWWNHYRTSKWRCTPKGPYYPRVKFYLTASEVKDLWFRDKAWLLKLASLDRIDSKGHYELSNCRFIEWLENVRNGSREAAETRKRNRLLKEAKNGLKTSSSIV